MKKAQIRQGYDEIAPKYDRQEAIPEMLGLRRLRERLLTRARGRTLEVAVGTGKSFRHYPHNCELTALDLSRRMLHRAQAAADRSSRSVALIQGDTESLPFPNDAFDTVVDAMTLCTYTEPEAALGELARVCRPEGGILLLEHGRSDRGWLARFQDWRAEKHYRALGCRWNRCPREQVERAGLELRRAKRVFFGIFHLMEAVPSHTSAAPTSDSSAL